MVSSATIALRTQICSNATYRLRNNWSLTQILHLPLCSFPHKKHQTNGKNTFSWIHQSEEIHQTQTCASQVPTSFRASQVPTSFRVSMRYSSASLITTFPPHSDKPIPPFQNNSQDENLFMLTATSKLEVFFKVQCHIYCTICVFLHSLTCLKMYYLVL